LITILGVSFKFCDSSFCFVNSHLPARAVRVINRNQDFGELMEGLGLGLKKVDLSNQFHHVFWLGDLNYRVDFTREKILQLLKMRHWDALKKGDQLTNQKDAMKTFYGFKEGSITFPPTYRYERGSCEWSKKVQKKFDFTINLFYRN
jgi:phosphatidylinositol-3,4,5-trisphosphate 5-phosphatase 2